MLSLTFAPAQDWAFRQTTSKKSVSFGHVSIQEYPMDLGDHPCCSAGVPVQIGWTPITSCTCSVDKYEHVRIDGRCTIVRKNLRIPLKKRVEILLHVGYSIHDIALATLEVESIQKLRRESLQQAQRGGRTRFQSMMETTGVSIKRAQSLPKDLLRTTSQRFRKIIHQPRVFLARSA